MEGFEGLTEEQLEQLLELGIFDDEQSALNEQMRQADVMRNAAGPEMRGNGRVMVAANPLEFLGQGLQKYQAKKDIDQIGMRRKEIGSRQIAARKALLDALRSKPQPFEPGVAINDPGIDTSGFA